MSIQHNYILGQRWVGPGQVLRPPLGDDRETRLDAVLHERLGVVVEDPTHEDEARPGTDA